MKIGASIKKCRQRAGMSQEELARKAKLTQSYISNVEKGKPMPRAATLKKIASALRIPMPVLVAMSLERKDAENKKMYDALKKPFNAIIENFLTDFYE